MWSKWDDRFMQMAKIIGSWSSCFQDSRKIGAIIVKNKRILTTGYNGAPAGIKSCTAGRQALCRARRVPAAQAEHTVRHAA